MDVARGPGTAENWMELGGEKGHGGSGRLLEKCANMKVDIEALERLMEPENEEVSQRYILKYSTRGGRNIFQLFDTQVSVLGLWFKGRQGECQKNSQFAKFSG